MRCTRERFERELPRCPFRSWTCETPSVLPRVRVWMTLGEDVDAPTLTLVLLSLLSVLPAPLRSRD